MKTKSLILLFLLFALTLYASDKQYPKVNVLLATGSDLMNFPNIPNNNFGAQHPEITQDNIALLNSPGISTSIQNTIELVLNNHSALDIDANVIVDAYLICFLLDGTSTENNISLTVDFKAGENKKSNISGIYAFTNAYQIELKIISVKIEGGSELKDKIKNFLELNATFQKEQVTGIDYNTVVTGLTACEDTKTDELVINWNPVEGAEKYEIEYTFTDNYSDNIGSSLNESQVLYNFKDNSTRISLKGNYYRFPLLYERGYILYRVRVIGMGGENLQQPVYCKWSGGDDKGIVSSFFPYIFHHKDAHMKDKINWQVSSTFAEDGKRSDVTTYYDGTYRSRQTVTGFNLEKQDILSTQSSSNLSCLPGSEKIREVIAGETKYDFQGRPSVNLLPAPTNSLKIEYLPLLNRLENTNQSYNWQDFDKPSFNCTLSGKLDAGINSNGIIGSSGYYSPKNPNKLGFNAFIPDADGYPFTQVSYLQDNTGRISSQSGVGETFQLSKGHETRFFYATPNEKELYKMFGSEVGDAIRYKKNAVIDQNGQVAVTYINTEGKVIATCLAGEGPENLEKLDDQNINTIKVSLLDKNLVNTVDKTITTEHSFLVSYPCDYIFDYSITPQTLNAVLCDTTTVCLDCIYDIIITLNHNEKCDAIPIFEYSGTIGDLMAAVDSADLSCNYNSANDDYPRLITKRLEIGTYVITKKITVNQQAALKYVEEIFEDKCITKWEEILQDELSRIDTMDCYSSCLDCQQPPVPSPDCDTSYCEPNPNRCEVIRKMMLSDMSPGGQYAQFDRKPDETVDAGSYPLSIFNTDNLLPSKLTQPFLSSIPNFIYEDSKDLKYNINKLVNNWLPEYAEKLIEFHPEYCKYGWCQKTEIINTLDFDVKILSTPNFKDAEEKGYVAIGASEVYKYLLDSDPWSQNTEIYNALSKKLENVGCDDNNPMPADKLAKHMAYCYINNPSQYNPGITPEISNPPSPVCDPPPGYLDTRIFGNATTVQEGKLANAEWTFLRSIYLSEKNKLIQESINNFNPNNSCNTLCIGSHYFNISNSNIPCSNINSFLYTDKQSRFGTNSASLIQSLIDEADISANLEGLTDYNDLCQIGEILMNQSSLINESFGTIYCGNSTSSPCEISGSLNLLLNTIISKLKDSLSAVITITEEQLPLSIRNAGISIVSASVFEQKLIRIYFRPCNSPIEIPFLQTETGFVKPVSCCCISNIACPGNANCRFDIKVTYANNVTNNIPVQTKCNFLEDCVNSTPVICPEPTVYTKSVRNYLSSIFQFILAYNLPPSPEQLMNLLPSLLKEKNGKPAVSVSLNYSSDFIVTITYGEGDLELILKELELKKAELKEFESKKAELKEPGLKELELKKAELKKLESKELELKKAELKKYIKKPDICTIVLKSNPNISNWFDIKSIASITPDFSGIQNNITKSFNLKVLTFNNNETVIKKHIINGSSSCWDMNQCPESINFCDSIPEFSPVPPINDCVKDLLLTAYSNANIRYGQWEDSIRNDLLQRYYDKCLTAAEIFNMTYDDKQYHYTLSYYDQAGNLVKTIPPAGVKLLDDVQVEQIAYERANGNDITLIPDHIKYTLYRYNTLNELIWQQTPDAGQSNFYYDGLGRIVASQNAQQQTESDYSYTRYDKLGRIIESGKILDTYIDASITKEWKDWDSFIDSKSRSEITFSKYDVPYSDLISQKFGTSGQRNLRNRISSVLSFENSYDLTNGKYIHGTHYSYDIIGNVDKLIQDYADALFDNIGDKTLEYKFDLQSGKVNELIYQRGAPDQFMHKYSYDASNRLIRVETSLNGLIFETDAEYFYYRHGLLARTELGQEKVQGLDYLYTLQGFIKGVNGTTLKPETDMGQDGINQEFAGNFTGAGYDALHNSIAIDAFGYVLDYYTGDYKSIGGNAFLNALQQKTGFEKDLYNGNISRMYTQIQGLGNIGFNYSYDQLNRLKYQHGWKLDDNTLKELDYNAYVMKLYYDADGNISLLLRNGTKEKPDMDLLNYNYYTRTGTTYNAGGIIPFDATNKLAFVTDNISKDNYTEDIDNQMPDNYRYDLIGNFIADESEKMKIIWNLQNKVSTIVKSDGTTINFEYDALGNRVMKEVVGSLQDKKTFYVRDARGNILSTYTNIKGISDIIWDEAHIYGSSRIGIYKPEFKIPQTNLVEPYSYITRGYKQYELANHLGNVLATITDKKLPHINSGTIEYYTADISSCQDYYPFGMEMPGRKFNSDKYKFGFNGQLKVDEIYGDGNCYDFGARFYDNRVGKWLSLDPMQTKYPYLSPYQYCANNPNIFIDPDGEKIRPVNGAAETALSIENQSMIGFLAGSTVENGIWTTGLNPDQFKNYDDFYTISKERLKKKNETMTDKEIELAYNFYLALKDPDIYEVEVVVVENTVPKYGSESKGTKGSTVGGNNLLTKNSEESKVRELINKAGSLTKELGDALFKGKKYKTGEKTETGEDKTDKIKPDKWDEGYAFFENEYYAGKQLLVAKIKGVIWVKGTVEDSVVNFKNIINSLHKTTEK